MGTALHPGDRVTGASGQSYTLVRQLVDNENLTAHQARDPAGNLVFLKQYKDPSTLFTPWFGAYHAYQGEVLRRLGGVAVRQLVVAVREHFVFQDEYFQAHDWAEGRDLRDVIAGNPRPEARLVLARVFLFSLARLHSAGVVHSDLKPENIRVISARDDAGEQAEYLRITDFDWAILADRPGMPWGEPRGTPGYWSLEHLRGAPVCPASDVQTAALILYELFTGANPVVVALGGGVLSSDEFYTRSRRLLEARAFPHPCLQNPAIPGSLGDAIWSALEPRAEDRPTAETLHRRLLPAAAGATRLVLLHESGLGWRFNPPLEPGHWVELSGDVLRMFRREAGQHPTVALARPYEQSRSWVLVPPARALSDLLFVNGAPLRSPLLLAPGDRLLIHGVPAGAAPLELTVTYEPA